MTKARITIFIISVLTAAGLFYLPRSVVNSTLLDEDLGAENTGQVADPHAETPAEVRENINSLKRQLDAESPNQKNAIFADSLANLYRIAGKFDSAAWYAESAAEFFNEAPFWLKAADNYYEAFTFAFDEARQKQFAEKSRSFYAKVLAQEPSNLEAKTKMAMTYLSGSNPMQGITMLREVLEADPENKLALFNLGMLSIQSGQYERAIERFEYLLSLDATNSQAMLLLGIAYMNSGSPAKAREILENLKKLDKDPAVQATVDSYLRDLKK
ncbi:MAG TPA: tetratricopeptide repeat protein [Cyclobacteriaceae bacterium]|nr:tetratricopeptide repeat protein [Cyclobacteriaceae bacterium]